MYLLQYRRTTRRPPDWRGLGPFFTAGIGGYYYYQAHGDGEIGPLRLAAFGGGFERVLNRHVSFRLEGSGFGFLDDEGFLGFRVLAGVSIPIGAYRVRGGT